MGKTVSTNISDDATDATIAGFIDVVAKFFRRTYDDLMSKRRDETIATARATAMYLVRRHTGLSVNRIAAAFRVDYTTISASSTQTIPKRIEKSDLFRRQIDYIVLDLEEAGLLPMREIARQKAMDQLHGCGCA